MIKNLGGEGETQAASKAVGGNQRHRNWELLERSRELTRELRDEKNTVT